MANNITWAWNDSRVTDPGIDFTDLDIGIDDILEYDSRQTFFPLNTSSVSMFGTVHTNFGYDLSGCEIVPQFGKLGYLAPPITLYEDKIPQLAGSLLRQRNIDQRKIDLPFILKAPNYDTLIHLFRTLVSNMMLASETGALIFNKGETTERILYCTFNDGLLGDDNDDNQFIIWAKAILSFTAHDPYYYVKNDSVSVTTYESSPPVFFANPFFDRVILAESTFSDNKDIANLGDAEAWPIWLIEGPITSDLVLTNITTGKILTLEEISVGTNIVEGERVLIDTRPGFKTVTSSIHGDIFSRLTNSSALWSLASGLNNVNFSGSGTSASTKFYYKFDTPYLTY